MYERFFELKQRPFSAVPNTDGYYAAEDIERSRNGIQRIIDRGDGPGLVIGRPGCGKTLLSELIGQQCESNMEIAKLGSAKLTTRRALFQCLLYELGQPFRGLDEAEARLSLQEYLDRSERPIVFLVDEAHLLPIRILEELRLLSNAMRDGTASIQVVLFGNSQLEERFSSPKLESFNQRIAFRGFLNPWRRHETLGFLSSRLESAGGNAAEIMPEDAMNAIHVASDGIPRLASQIADHALVLSCLGGHRQVTPEAIQEAWADLQQLPTPWMSNSDSDGADSVVEFGELSDDPATPEDELDEVRTISIDTGRTSNQTSDEVDIVEPSTPAVNPFMESFADEETVIDRFASLDDALSARPKVEVQQLWMNATGSTSSSTLHNDGESDVEHNNANPPEVVDSSQPAPAVESLPAELPQVELPAAELPSLEPRSPSPEQSLKAPTNDLSTNPVQTESAPTEDDRLDVDTDRLMADIERLVESVKSVAQTSQNAPTDKQSDSAAIEAEKATPETICNDVKEVSEALPETPSVRVDSPSYEDILPVSVDSFDPASDPVMPDYMMSEIGGATWGNELQDAWDTFAVASNATKEATEPRAENEATEEATEERQARYRRLFSELRKS